MCSNVKRYLKIKYFKALPDLSSVKIVLLMMSKMMPYVLRTEIVLKGYFGQMLYLERNISVLKAFNKTILLYKDIP